MSKNIQLENFGTVGYLNGMNMSVTVNFTNADLTRLLSGVKTNVCPDDQAWQQALAMVISKLDTTNVCVNATLHTNFPESLRYDLGKGKDNDEDLFKLSNGEESPLEKELPSKLSNQFKIQGTANKDEEESTEKDGYQGLLKKLKTP